MQLSVLSSVQSYKKPYIYNFSASLRPRYRRSSRIVFILGHFFASTFLKIKDQTDANRRFRNIVAYAMIARRAENVTRDEKEGTTKRVLYERLRRHPEEGGI